MIRVGRAYPELHRVIKIFSLEGRLRRAPLRAIGRARVAFLHRTQHRMIIVAPRGHAKGERCERSRSTTPARDSLRP